ncbi:hypothetical protein RUMGNA_01091 [Mediterraneibacter gnavus ATCC 29149]|uniref:Uncharacterized protein n=1 Tax=Mediterraneibacter gnavus (strain ATCC 29149 / DSM 114966 / JCM 6515 / VPI C7-9) TaxID=411470 RepID=A7B0L5_MEDG7|nr:hypothetical protein RUMGNA_01091 [Mediterraneibacter gnavus ATCC 29149]
MPRFCADFFTFYKNLTRKRKMILHRFNIQMMIYFTILLYHC